MATHHLEPNADTLRGCFCRDFEPVLEIDPGDTVVYRLLDAAWGVEGPRKDGTPRARAPRVEGRDTGHALSGPIHIRGAKPCMALMVRIERLVPGDFGWSCAGEAFPENLAGKLGLDKGTERNTPWEVHVDSGFAVDPWGREIALHPFLGVMGMPPDEPGCHPTFPPRFCGGNLDCKELREGSTLYLPISIEGGGFMAGDPHAAQGDGEVSGVAIECPMERAELTFDLLPVELPTPVAETADAWITLGFGSTLDEATIPSLSAMLTLLQQVLRTDRTDALELASLTVDLRVTQVCNGVQGIHAMLPKERLTRLGAASTDLRETLCQG